MAPPDDLDALARRVLLEESDDEGTSAALITAVDRVFTKMKIDLSHLVGAGGASALVRRALAQAQRERPLLQGVAFNPDRGLEGVEEALAGAEAGDVEAAAAAVFAHLLELLVSLLGSDLGLRPVRKHWPGAFLARDTDSKEPGT